MLSIHLFSILISKQEGEEARNKDPEIIKTQRWVHEEFYPIFQEKNEEDLDYMTPLLW